MSQFKESVSVAKENLKYAKSNFGISSQYYKNALFDLFLRCSHAKISNEAIKYGEEWLAINTKFGDNSSLRCLLLVNGLIKDRLSVDSNDSTIVSLYGDYLERLKDYVIKRFGWMNSEERQSFTKDMIESMLMSDLLAEENLKKMIHHLISYVLMPFN